MSLILFQSPRLGPEWNNIPNMSPFCIKLETFFRMAKIDYTVKRANVFKAPKRKIPYVAIDGELMGDSALIIDRLRRERGFDLDAHLSKEERAISRAFVRMVEEGSYFAGAHLRWTDKESGEYVRRFFLKMLPPVIGPFIFKKIFKNFKNITYSQGTGRHSREEILEMLRRDYQAISDFLGDKKFFMGAEPSLADATMFGFFVSVLDAPWKGGGKEVIAAFPNICNYCERMKKEFWSDHYL